VVTERGVEDRIAEIAERNPVIAIRKKETAHLYEMLSGSLGKDRVIFVTSLPRTGKSEIGMTLERLFGEDGVEVRCIDCQGYSLEVLERDFEPSEEVRVCILDEIFAHYYPEGKKPPEGRSAASPQELIAMFREKYPNAVFLAIASYNPKVVTAPFLAGEFEKAGTLFKESEEFFLPYAISPETAVEAINRYLVDHELEMEEEVFEFLSRPEVKRNVQRLALRVSGGHPELLKRVLDGLAYCDEVSEVSFLDEKDQTDLVSAVVLGDILRGIGRWAEDQPMLQSSIVDYAVKAEMPKVPEACREVVGRIEEVGTYLVNWIISPYMYKHQASSQLASFYSYIHRLTLMELQDSEREA